MGTKLNEMKQSDVKRSDENRDEIYHLSPLDNVLY